MFDAVDEDESRTLHREISFEASLKKRHRNRSSEPIWCHDLHVDIIAWHAVMSIADRFEASEVQKRWVGGLPFDAPWSPVRGPKSTPLKPASWDPPTPLYQWNTHLLCGITAPLQGVQNIGRRLQRPVLYITLWKLVFQRISGPYRCVERNG